MALEVYIQWNPLAEAWIASIIASPKLTLNIAFEEETDAFALKQAIARAHPSSLWNDHTPLTRGELHNLLREMK